MAFTRQNVWELGGDWADPILWYARGVKAMKARPISDPTSWRFFGAIHGFNQGLWQAVGALNEGDQPPSRNDMRTYWAQCQHGSWFFLPWHRGYLIALEAVVRDAITQLGGPGATWALPYWNYFKPNENPLPPAFASADWPDGTGDNPLFEARRFGPDDSGNVFIPLDQVDQNALGDAKFEGPGQGASPGFGGIRTGFSHGGGNHGGVEMQPHDMVHVLVGGGDPGNPGLMSNPDIAGLDPIFYLHHSNIDRLWEVWNKIPATPAHTNPSQTNWMKGPASTGERAFVMPMPGGRSWTYTPADTVSIATLGYSYDDVSAPSLPLVASRRQRLGMAPAPAPGGPAMAEHVELMGASSGGLSLTGSSAKASVQLDHAVRNRMSSSLQGMAGGPAAPDRIFLNLQNVRGANDATALTVYINVPEGDDPAKHPELKAGSIGLFGLSKASAMDGPHAGDGLNFSIEISHVIDTLHLRGALNVNQLHVNIVPRKPVPNQEPVTIGHISVYRQSS